MSRPSRGLQRYLTVRIPSELDEVIDYVVGHPDGGFDDRSDLVRRAIERLLAGVLERLNSPPSALLRVSTLAAMCHHSDRVADNALDILEWCLRTKASPDTVFTMLSAVCEGVLGVPGAPEAGRVAQRVAESDAFIACVKRIRSSGTPDQERAIDGLISKIEALYT